MLYIVLTNPDTGLVQLHATMLRTDPNLTHPL